MSDFNFRFLNGDDQNLLFDFVRQRELLFRRTALSREQIGGMLVDPKCLVGAVFRQGKLCGTVAGVRWSSYPYFSLSRFFADVKSFDTRVDFVTTMAQATELVVRPLINEKRTTFLYVMRKSHFMNSDIDSDRSWLIEYNPFFEIFQFNFEAHYGAGDEIRHAGFCALAESTHAAFPMAIRRAVLAPKYYRKIILENQDVDELVPPTKLLNYQSLQA